MHLRIPLAALACAGALGACAPAATPLPPASQPQAAPAAPVAETAAPRAQAVRDIHSFARPDEARVTHVDLDLHADFGAKLITGTATLSIETAPGARELVLDTRDLAIREVTDGAGNALRFALGQPDSILGRALTIQLPQGARKVAIVYGTSPNAAALQWLTPEQTAGKRHPYLFSQGQAILTRTWIPTQDSPGIRQTYAARIVVPPELKAVMSAEMLTPQGEPAEGGQRRAFRFRLATPVPPYLIALAVGDIAFRPLGPRTGVYTEPSMLDKSAYELADVEKMVAAAESLYGPYRW
ncbi:MAG TPA: hypothetical protein VEX86_28030, partial [Longimicrobium sp.]|nr:hypothetical protein [Longimicrobium sp.]